MNRLDIINYLITKYNLSSYLEIGVHTGDVLDGCVAEYKTGVDPDYNSYKGPVKVYYETSDEFFDFLNRIEPDNKFDLIFIDGMHEAEQVYRDITNALLHLSDNGYIIVHDCNPPTEWHTRTFEEYKTTGGDWNGDVYKGFIKAFMRHGLIWNTVDTDWGVGILERGDENDKKVPDYEFTQDWNHFNMHKKEILQLITEKEFKEIY